VSVLSLISSLISPSRAGFLAGLVHARVSAVDTAFPH
jgi:hypothetical protein